MICINLFYFQKAFIQIVKNQYKFVNCETIELIQLKIKKYENMAKAAIFN